MKVSAYQKHFLAAMQRNYPTIYGEIASATERNYQELSEDTAFSFRSANPLDRRLDFCAYFLALIKSSINAVNPMKQSGV